MTINLMHITNSLNVGGLETLLLSLLSNIDKNKFTPYVCTLTEDGSLIPEFEKNGIKVFALSRKDGIDVGLIFTLKKLLKQHNIQILHTHNFGAWLYGAFAGLLSKVAVVNTEHSNVPETKFFQMFGEKFISTFTEKIICDSYSVFDFMATKQKIHQSKLKMILNGVDCNTYGCAKSTVSFKKKMAIPENHVVIGIVARLVPVKNHRGILEALKLLRNDTNRFRLLIVGDGVCRAELEDIVEKNKMNNIVSFLGSRRDIPEIMSELDIFILNSFSEGLPITILEAMASRTAVIATDVGGNREILGSDGESGVLIKSDCPEDLSAAMLRLIKDPALREKLGNNARKNVVQKASLVSMVKKYEEIYHQCTDIQ